MLEIIVLSMQKKNNRPFLVAPLPPFFFGGFSISRPLNDFKPASPATILFGLFMLWWGWIGTLAWTQSQRR